ncbi:hypothetical protein ACQSSU_20715 [Micromonospora echinospora]
MTWRVDGADGRWLALGEGGQMDGDDATFVEVLGAAGQPVLVTPTGPSYAPQSDTDPVWQYLMALHVVPGPLTITGNPPAVPPAAPAPDDVVF